jgi:hypothetical protein
MNRALFVAGAMVTFFAARTASAQVGNSPLVVTPGGGMPDIPDSPRGQHGNTQGNSYKLFDTFSTVRSYHLTVGPIWTRQIQDETPQQRLTGFDRIAPLTGEISLGMTYATPYKPFYLLGGQRTILRVIDDKSFSWSIFHQDVGGGLQIGPLEPDVRVGVSVLTADIFHAEPSIQLLSPRVSAGIGIHVGRFKVDVRGHAEYLWRWFGPDYLVRGVTLGLSFDLPPPPNPLAEIQK